jgi:hypothetical protein
LLLEQQPSPFQLFATNRGIAATTSAQFPYQIMEELPVIQALLALRTVVFFF